MTQNFDDLYLSESDKLDFLNLPVVKNNLANCWFDDQELIMPSGQGRTLKAVVYSALEVFKITIASRQAEIDNLKQSHYGASIGRDVFIKQLKERHKVEIDKLEVEIKETQAFLNNQNHIKQTKIDELQKRIDDALKELEFIHSNKTQNSNNAINILKGNQDD